jgi:membrane protein
MWRAKLREYPVARVLYRATMAYHDHRCLYMGAALSFFAALSVIPLVYCAVIALARIVGSTDAAQSQLRVVLEQYVLPGTAGVVMDRVQALLARGGLWSGGAWWGLILVLWSGVRFYETLQNVFAAAWGWSRMRPFLHRHGISVLAFGAAGLLLGIAIVLSVTASTFAHASERIAGLPIAPAAVALADTLPLLLAVAVYFLVYKFLPPVDVPWRMALILGAGTALVWEVMRRCFIIFVTLSGAYNMIYGPLSSLMLLLVWVYMTASILLFGAELGAAWQLELAQRLAAQSNPYLPGMQPPVPGK